MKIIKYNLGNFTRSSFDMTSIVANDYIPLITINHTVEIEGLLYYYKPSFNVTYKKPNTLKNIKDAFEMAYYTRKIEINGRTFFIAKGVFFSEAGVPLMVCAMKKEAYLNESVSRFSDIRSETFSYTNYVLFYSTSFFTDPGLMPLNRRLQKEILQACFEKGIEVRMLSSLEIEKNTFARLFEVKKTKSLTQLEAYMNQILPNFLHNEGEDTFVEQEFEPVVIHREELSVEDEALLFDNESTVTEPVVQEPVIPNRQLTLEEVIEMAELEAEAAQFDVPLEFSESSDDEFDDDEDYGEEFHWGDEQAEDEEEMQNHEEYAVELEELARDEEAAHTVSQLSMPAPHPAESLVERMRPLQNLYNVQMQAYQDLIVTGEAVFQNDQVVASFLTSLATNRATIQLIDDTE